MAYMNELQDALAAAQEWLRHEYAQLHTGRASIGFLDGVTVEAYGTYQPIKNVASLAIEDARTIRISPWDKTQLKEIERALQSSNLGFSIVNDGEGIRAAFPLLTQENRQKLVKVIKEKLEDARITVRKAREAAMTEIKAVEKAEDAAFRATQEVQKKVEAANQALEALFEKKEAEVLTV